LIPADIANKQFATTRIKEGYDQDEVDDFLDRVEVAYRNAYQKSLSLEQDNAQLRNQVNRLTDAPTQQLSMQKPPQPTALVEKVLQVAEDAAAKHVAEAKEEADEIVRQAGGKAARLVEEATDAAKRAEEAAAAKAERIVNDGYAEKARKFAELEARHGQVQAALEQMEERAQKVRSTLAEMIEDYDREAKNG